MPNKCSRCNQIGLCRKNFLLEDFGYPNTIRTYEWICKDCDDYYIILYKESIKDKEKKVKDFIKRRDDALRKNIRTKSKKEIKK